MFLSSLYLVLGVVYLTESSNIATPLVVPVQALNGTSNGACPPESELAEVRDQLKEIVSSTLEEYIIYVNSVGSCNDLGSDSTTGYYWVSTNDSSPVKMFCDFTAMSPISSCADLPADSPAQYYWLLPTTGPPAPAVQRYCHPRASTRPGGCGDTIAWTRVGFLNMSNPTHNCPSPWMSKTSPRRTCGISKSSSTSCSSITLQTPGAAYTEVCGRIVAYQDGLPEGYDFDIRSIEHPYLDGISLTHGPVNSRQHIWSFITTAGEVGRFHSKLLCDCSNGNSWPHSTPLIGSSYFCDTGNHADSRVDSLYDTDPLWDGQGCGLNSTCCQFNNPPWFHTSLQAPTNDDLEVRNCQALFDGYDTLVELIEIYIQ